MVFVPERDCVDRFIGVSVEQLVVGKCHFAKAVVRFLGLRLLLRFFLSSSSLSLLL